MSPLTIIVPLAVFILAICFRVDGLIVFPATALPGAACVAWAALRDKAAGVHVGIGESLGLMFGFGVGIAGAATILYRFLLLVLDWLR